MKTFSVFDHPKAGPGAERFIIAVMLVVLAGISLFVLSILTGNGGRLW